MAIPRYKNINIEGRPVPGGALEDRRHNDFSLKNVELPNPSAANAGGVGTGSGVINGGYAGVSRPGGKNRAIVK